MYIVFGSKSIQKEEIRGMIRKIRRRLVNRESVTYIIFGCLTTAVDWVTYTALWRIGADYRVSTALSWVAAVLFAFITNKLFVFRSFELRPVYLWREFASFVTARAATGVLTMVMMVGMVSGLGWNEFVGKLIVSAVNLLLNYIFSKWFIFRKTDGGVKEDGV